MANTQLAVPCAFFVCGVEKGFTFQVGSIDESLRETHTHAHKHTHAANNTEQMNNKTNHTVNTLRRGALTIYHKSASGEKQNSCAVRCKTERETDRKRETDRYRERDVGPYTMTQMKPPIRLINIPTQEAPWRCYKAITRLYLCLQPLLEVVTAGLRPTSYSSLKP